MAKKIEKTNVMRMLDQHKIKYDMHTYPNQPLPATDVAMLINKPIEIVFKTLVTVSGTLHNYVFIVPGGEELDLKKAAKAVGEKSIDMLKQKDLLPLTGYVHGGCSPIGMKKPFTTVIHSSAEKLSTIIVSAGKIGYQVELSLEDLRKIIPINVADIIVK